MFSASELIGTWPALITPFSDNAEQIDYDSLAALVDYVLAAKVNGVVVCGSTGEALALSADEYKRVVRFVRERVDRRVPCVAGITASSTRGAVEIACIAKDEGVDAALLVGPPYVKPSPAGIIEHFAYVRKQTQLPLIAYNNPGRAALNISAETTLQMARQGLIIGSKESSGSIDQVMDIACSMGDNFSLLSGEDSLVHAVMAVGGRGVISASANLIPEIFVEITDHALRGQWKQALTAQGKALPFIRALFTETNPVPVKCALALKGVIASSAVRLPLMPATKNTEATLRSLLGV